MFGDDEDDEEEEDATFRSAFDMRSEFIKDVIKENSDIFENFDESTDEETDDEDEEEEEESSEEEEPSAASKTASQAFAYYKRY